MVKVWDTGQGDDFTCGKCGAVYAVTVHRYPMRDKDTATCKVCDTVMAEWNSTYSPTFKLKDHPKND